MVGDVQKASMLKRISACILDLIAIAIIATLFSYLISLISGFDSWNQRLEEAYSTYENQYGITFRISAEEYMAGGEEYMDRYDAAYDALLGDEEAMKAYGVVSQLMVLTLSLSLFFSFLIWEFIIPLFLHDGTTVGKKIFGLCVMRTNCVKINGVSLFIRAILGKYTIETMIPAYLIMMVFMGSVGIVAPIVVCGILVLQLILLFSTKKNQLIHCILSDTCVVDYASQMIYENEEALLEAMKNEGKERAQNDPYY